MLQTYRENAAVILAHGPWFDACLWHSVVLPLRRDGLRVVAAQLPFTSLDDDIRTLTRAITRVAGPFVLVGHSYAGAVISASAPLLDQAEGLVYISALVPAVGENVNELLDECGASSGPYNAAPDDRGFIWASEAGYRNTLAPRCMPHQRAILEATQRPIARACLEARIPDMLWSRKPSWSFISEDDLVVPPEAQARMAKRISARVFSKATDHAAPLTDPDAVIETILDATYATLVESCG